MKKIILTIMTLVILALILNGCSVEEISKSQICSNQKSECLKRCDEKVIGYFCENDCQESYDICMSNN